MLNKKVFSSYFFSFSLLFSFSFFYILNFRIWHHKSMSINEIWRLDLHLSPKKTLTKRMFFFSHNETMSKTWKKATKKERKKESNLNWQLQVKMTWRDTRNLLPSWYLVQCNTCTTSSWILSQQRSKVKTQIKRATAT